MRELRYAQVAADLRSRIEAGEFRDRGLLPSESELSAAYDASRVTVRRALEELRSTGLVDARQGYGWFVRRDPLRQTLARLGTIEGQLAASGATVARRILDFGFVKATRRAREVFGAGSVLRVRRLNLADGEPFARVTVWVPERLARGLSLDEVEARTFYELLPARIGGATQTIGADSADPADAELLQIPAGAPVLRAERITHDVDGEPVIVAEYVFPAHRTEFVVELPADADASIAPSGLRLVE